MKKPLAKLSAAAIASQLLVAKAFALLPPECPDGINCTDDGVAGIRNAILRVVKTVLDFVLLLAVVYVIVAGIRLVVSGGDDGEKDKAKKTIIYVIIGIIIVLLARVIVTFIGNIFQ